MDKVGIKAQVAAADLLSPLPEELIDAVCKHLLPRDIRNLRLACRTLKEKSYHTFAICYFKVTQVMLTRESLQQLIELANDNRFGPNIKELQLCLVTFPEQATRRLTGHPSTKQELVEFRTISSLGKHADEGEASLTLHEEQEKYRRALKRRRRRLYGRYMHDQNKLRKQCIDVNLLADALSRLPSLESIALIGRIDEVRPPWGARKIKHDIGIWPPSVFLAHQSRNRLRPFYDDLMYDKDVVRLLQRFSTHSMAVVFGAMLRSGIRLRHSLRIEGAPYSFLVPAKDDSRRLFPAGTPAKTFAEERTGSLFPSLSGLRELSLQTFHYYNYQTHDFCLSDYAPLSWLEELVPLLPGLRVLSISGAEYAQEPSIFGQLVTTTFHHLLKLEIGDTRFRVEDIIRILHNHSTTLEEFSIENSRPVTTHNYVELLHGIIGLEALVSVELVRGSSRSIQRRFNHNWTLDGIGDTRIHIQELTPSDFQATLGRKLQEIENSSSRR